MWLVYIPTSSTVLEETARKKERFFSFDVATSKEVVYKETCSSLINAPMEHQNPFFGRICSMQVVVVGLI